MSFKMKIIMGLLLCVVLGLVLGLLLKVVVDEDEWLMDYDQYTLHEITLDDVSLRIEGGDFQAGVAGYDSSAYRIEGDSIYLAIYQQDSPSNEEARDTISIAISANFSDIENVYLLQKMGEPVQIWPAEPEEVN